ncbi:hypothetical protein NQ317_012743 [Molorchus minor]|uniref:Uncharacterized protein n=1 Tax=Molorchus minor TaxID=1323400 RepID=A0ABQ9K1W3_9CUCU|nr:hypothetical protein NQ317_012743 [Molorchus minor]
MDINKTMMVLVLDSYPIFKEGIQSGLVRNKTYNHLDVDVVIILTMLAVYMFTSSFIYNIDGIAKIYTFFSNMNEFGKPTEFDENNKLCNRASFIHYIYLELLILMLLFLSDISNVKQCKQHNLEYGMSEVCGLFSYIWLPFDIDYFPVKEIYLSLQLFGSHYLYMIAGILAWTAVETIQHIIIRLRHVKYLFVEAIEEKDQKKQREKFNLTVRYHDEVLKSLNILQ